MHLETTSMKNNKHNLSRRPPKKLIMYIALGLCFATGLTIYLGKHNTQNYISLPLGEATQKEQLKPNDNTQPNSPDQGIATHQTSQTTHLKVLLIGTDKRPQDTSIGNTDTLIVANIDSESGCIELLSVPRDTQVDIPGYGKGKINAIARLGQGPKATKTALEDLLGQHIDGYVVTNFAGFKSIIDILGGITVNVEKNMYYQTGDSEDGIINLKKGVQKLNGGQALQYIRFRHDQLGDITRINRQQTILKSLSKELMQINTLSKLPWLIPQIYRMVDTDLPLNKLVLLANSAIHLNSTDVISQTLPGNFATENDISYWKVSKSNCRLVASQLFTQGKTANVFMNDATQTQVKQENFQSGSTDKIGSKEEIPTYEMSDLRKSD